VVAALFDAVTGVVKSKDKVLWPGFGAFSGTMRPARQGRNPATGATIDIPEALVCKFSQAAALKSTLNS
jgi:DNA-binding protein HU-beta